jgi:hypothetical protein
MRRVAVWLTLLVCSCFLSTRVAGFYGVAVPVARKGGLSPVPDMDCIFVYSCAPLTSSSILPPISSDPFDKLPIDLVPSTSNLSSFLRPVYVGRAAGRCQRRTIQMQDGRGCKHRE